MVKSVIYLQMSLVNKILFENLKNAGEITSVALLFVKQQDKIKLKRADLIELNDIFTELDNSVSELFFEIDKLNKKQTLKDNDLY